VNEIASSECSSFVSQLSAVPPVSGIDVVGTFQDTPSSITSTGYTGEPERQL